MAYTTVVTKNSVSKIGIDRYSVVVNVTINDGVSDIFNKDFSVRYDSNALNMVDIESALVDDIKAAWDQYAAENGIFNAAKFDSLVTDLQAQANIYINI